MEDQADVATDSLSRQPVVNSPGNTETDGVEMAPPLSRRKRSLSTSSIPSSPSPCISAKRTKFIGYRSSTPMSLNTFMNTEFSFDKSFDFGSPKNLATNPSSPDRVVAEIAPLSGQSLNASERSNTDDDLVECDLSSHWSMHQATSEVADSESAEPFSEDRVTPGMEIDFSFISLQRGQSYQSGDDIAIPAIAYTNLRNGRTFQSLVDRKIINLIRATQLDVDPEKSLWQQTDAYFSNLARICLEKSPDSGEKFPILHRHGNHLEITRSPFTRGANAPATIRTAVKKEWDRLLSEYGELSYLGDEHRALIDNAYNVLGCYQRALASRTAVDYMELNDLFGHFKVAFDELSMVEHAVREIFYYKNHYPRFLTAIGAIDN